MQRTGEQPVDLSVKEQNLLSTCSLARHHQRGARGETKGNEQQVAYVREYFVKAEAELPETYDGILALMDKNLIPSTSTGESKVLIITDTLPNVQQVMQRARPPRVPVSLMLKPPRPPRKIWLRSILSVWGWQ